MGEKGNVADVGHVAKHVPAAQQSGGLMHDVVHQATTPQAGQQGSDSGLMHDVVRGTTEAAARGTGAAAGIVGKKDDDEAGEEAGEPPQA